MFGATLDAERRFVPWSTLEIAFSIHNDYFLIMFYTGLAGLGLYLAIQIYSARLAWRIYSRTRDPVFKQFSIFVLGFSAMVTFTNFASNSYVTRIGPHTVYIVMIASLVGIYFNARQEWEAQAAPDEAAAALPSLGSAKPRSTPLPAPAPIPPPKDDPLRWLFT